MDFFRLETSPARRTFKENLGQANHFLVTIEVGLEAIRDGRIEPPGPTWTRWDPKNPKRSADRSSGFAGLGALALLVDGLDAYREDALFGPRLIQSEKVAKVISQQSNATGHFEALVESCDLKESPPWAFANIARAWRHRLLHRKGDAKLKSRVHHTLKERQEEIAANFAGLDVDILIARFESGEAPSFKETTAMIRGSQELIERIDGYFIGILDLELFLRESVDAYLLAENGNLLKTRINNIWGKDRNRRLRTLRNVLTNQGMNARRDSAEGWLDAASLLDELADEPTASVRTRLEAVD